VVLLLASGCASPPEPEGVVVFTARFVYSEPLEIELPPDTIVLSGPAKVTVDVRRVLHCGKLSRRLQLIMSFHTISRDDDLLILAYRKGFRHVDDVRWDYASFGICGIERKYDPEDYPEDYKAVQEDLLRKGILRCPAS